MKGVKQIPWNQLNKGGLLWNYTFPRMLLIDKTFPTVL